MGTDRRGGRVEVGVGDASAAGDETACGSGLPPAVSAPAFAACGGILDLQTLVGDPRRKDPLRSGICESLRSSVIR